MRSIEVVLLLMLSTVCAGQSMSGTASGTFTVMQSMALTVTSAGTLPAITTALDYTNGKQVNSFSNLSVNSNVNWIIFVRSQNANFTPMSVNASANMPCSKLSTRKGGVASFFPLSTVNQVLATGNAGPPTTSGNTFNSDIFFNPGFGYGGGLYRLNLVYTLSNQ